MKKMYKTPALTSLSLETMQMMAISGETGGFANKEGQDNVVFDTRGGGWGSENWDAEEE